MNTHGLVQVVVQVRGHGLTYQPKGGPRARAKLLRGLAPALRHGTGPGEVDLAADLTPFAVPAGGTVTVDLYDGSVRDVFGHPAAFRVLRLFACWVQSGGGDAGVTVRPAAAHGHPLWWPGPAPGKTVYPGGPPELGGSPAGVAVTETARAVEFANHAAADAVLALVLLGASA